MTDVDLAPVGRAHRATEYLHSFIYFAPEADQLLEAAGLRPGRMCYFASRSAPMGAVTAGVTAATFYNFSPDVIARSIPRAWTLASPADVLDARMAAVDAAMQRLLPDDFDSPAVAELAEIARTATTVLAPEGRALYAGHAELPWPDEPHLVLWHAATLLREYRGDGHIMVLQRHGLSGIEASVTHTATGRGFPEPVAKVTRGWTDDEWGAAVERLMTRGLMDEQGLTAAGVAQREEIEAETDALDTAAWEHLGSERTARLIELGKTLTRTMLGNGALKGAGTGQFMLSR